ncbi:hypothetical protein OROMI_009750 [Orobanche minor]
MQLHTLWLRTPASYAMVLQRRCIYCNFNLQRWLLLPEEFSQEVVQELDQYWADKIHDLTVQTDGPHHVQNLHEPIGVAGQVIPWNFPLLMFAWNVGLVLAYGNSIILKTAEHILLSALLVSKLLYEAIERAFLATPEEAPVPISDADVYVKTHKRKSEREYKLPTDEVVKKVKENTTLDG